MSVYKEGYYFIDLIKKASKQIYPDACDFGAPIRKGDHLWNGMKQIVDWYGNPATKKVVTYGTGATVSCVIELIEEWRTGREEHFKLTYVTTRGDKTMDGYAYVERVK